MNNSSTILLILMCIVVIVTIINCNNNNYYDYVCIWISKYTIDHLLLGNQDIILITQCQDKCVGTILIMLQPLNYLIIILLLCI